ncbi:MAG: pseudouridine synthase [Lysobacterales bacterium]
MTRKTAESSERPGPSFGPRIQKILAAAGLGSRRQLERALAEGEIKVDGQQVGPGDRLTAGVTVEYSGHHYLVVADDQTQGRVLMYNKPEGVVCTRSDPEGRRTVFDHLPEARKGRWVGIGRLDINTTGLLLITTDGELANAMMHPSSGVDREYACRIQGEVTAEMIEQLKAGVMLDDGEARFSDIVDSGGTGGNHWYHVVLMEGRQREVRRLWDAVGVRVSRLKRVRYGAVMIPSRLKVGRVEELAANDVAVLREDVGLSAKAPAALTLKPLSRAPRPGGKSKGSSNVQGRRSAPETGKPRNSRTGRKKPTSRGKPNPKR